ncbi:MAG: hypothetical protein GY902_08285, partial [Planctomycetes bacterium]|nr:hypothetical protein [Planctomycetota bacterium]
MQATVQAIFLCTRRSLAAFCYGVIDQNKRHDSGSACCQVSCSYTRTRVQSKPRFLCEGRAANYGNACDACHDLEDAERHQFQHILPRQQLCLSCHDLKHDHQAVSMHEPMTQGECQACHDPHGSEQARAIRFEDRSTM